MFLSNEHDLIAPQSLDNISTYAYDRLAKKHWYFEWENHNCF